MLYIFLAMIFYTVAILFGTVASRHANTNLAAAITNTVSAILPVAVVIPVLTRKTLATQRFGIFMAILAGIGIALFAMAINKGYAENKVAIVAPIVLGGAIFLSTVLSYFLFKEKISLVQGLGLSILGIGLGLVVYARATGK